MRVICGCELAPYLGTVVEAIDVQFELAAISLHYISEGQIRKGFEQIVKISPVCLKGLPGFLQARLGEEKVASDLVGGDTRTPLPIDLVHGPCSLLLASYTSPLCGR